MQYFNGMQNLSTFYLQEIMMICVTKLNEAYYTFRELEIIAMM